MWLDSLTTWWTQNERLIQLLIDALGQTLVMVLASGIIGFLIGIRPGSPCT
ncbi:hypothetical protein JCM19237_844 [Photobacterium aphoticum]|uniref:Methionine ABC transporter permease protein n=1 Tax=Photobacterium aphoticum TaxID=754436 RepID=A0A090QXJ9_9GAMM|nr:hypothetical protein JCM19237_844 [Photobacterium aphoticum]